jgi:hypothetical protein
VDIVDNADHVIGRFAAHEDLANGVLTRPVDSSSRGVDENNFLAMQGIGPSEVAPAQANAHG